MTTASLEKWDGRDRGEREWERKGGEFFRASTKCRLVLPLLRNLLLAEGFARERDVRIEIAEIGRKEFRERRNRSPSLPRSLCQSVSRGVELA